MAVMLSASQMYGQTFLQAESIDTAYKLISAKAFSIEVPDCGHNVPHINTKWNSLLKKYVFDFGMHTALDNDRCINTDRQRIEIYKDGASYGQTIFERWKFFIDSAFQSSPNFCHLHQLKAANGTDQSSPIMTISTRYGTSNTDKLQIIFTPPATAGGVALTLYQTLLAPFKGVWLEAMENVTFGDTGTYNLVIRRVSDDKTLLTYSNKNLALWRPDYTNYNRPKYGLYRSLTTASYLRDEDVLFADFEYHKIATPYTPFSPLELRVSSVTDNLVSLAWKDTSAREDQFRIDRSIDGVNWYFNSYSPANSTAYTDTIYGAGTYYYRIRSENASGSSAYTDSVNVVISSVAIDENKKPKNYVLEQNYPNPFNPSTMINYHIAKDGYTRLDVYNVVGSKVASLVDGIKSAGSYSVQFSGSEVPSGLYFYKLESGGYSFTKKMLIIK